jgi:hypothetical protein
MKSKLLKIVVLSVLIISISVFNYSIADNTITENSIEDYIKSGLENNLEIEINELNIEILKKKYDDALDDAEKTPDAYGISNVLSNKYKREVTPVEAFAYYNEGVDNAKDFKKQLEKDIKIKCMEIINMNKKLDIEKLILNNIIEKRDIAKVKYDKELLTKASYDSYEIAVREQEIKLINLQNDLDRLDVELKALINIELGGDRLIVNGDIILLETTDKDIEAIIISTLENDTELKKQKLLLDAKIKKLEINAEYYNETAYEYKVVKIEKDNALLSYNSALQKKEVSIRNSYNNLLSAESSLNITVASTELENDKKEIAKLKYDSGLINREEYLSKLFV